MTWKELKRRVEDIEGNSGCQVDLLVLILPTGGVVPWEVVDVRVEFEAIDGSLCVEAEDPLDPAVLVIHVSV
jgi:hypothetical protein